MANGTGEIVGLSLSPDYKKLLVKVIGAVSLRESFVTASPNVLALDFEAAGFNGPQPLTRYDKGPVRMLKTDTSGPSQRVYVDFRGPVAPEYRIKRIGDFFIVFMDEEDIVRAQSAAPSKAPPGGLTGKADGSIPVKEDPDSNLSIEGASAKDDTIFLTVMDRNDPSRSYKITLSIDFESLGFNKASVSRLRTGSPAGKKRSRLRGKDSRAPRNKASKRNGKRGKKNINVTVSGPEQGLFDPSARGFNPSGMSEAMLVGSRSRPRLTNY
jgi:hypothetical protein